MPNWTKEQLEAINKDGSNIIVSAGAGSGKTSVLTERVIRKLTSGTHINELLILTFTNAAANHMKEEIRSSISAIPSLSRELDLLDSAYITTFDAFSLAIVKKYHTELNITSDIKITDSALLNLTKKNIMAEVFNDYYSTSSKEFLALIKDFALKDDTTLQNYLLTLYQKLELMWDKESYLAAYEDKYYHEEYLNSIEEAYLTKIKALQKYLQDQVNNASNYFSAKDLTNFEASLSSILKATDYPSLQRAFSTYTALRINKLEPSAKAYKEEINSIVGSLKDLLIYNDLSEIKEDILNTKQDTLTIVDILKEFNNRLTTYKKTNEIFTFTDIALLAINVVTNHPNIRKELTASFKEVLVDEYQDTSDIEEKFLSLITEDNLYMVGDIKQSIYRFRNANPTIFKNKYKAYSTNNGGYKIDLNNNFRSREEVITSINNIFNLIMDEELGGASYKETHQLIFGNTTYNNEGKNNVNHYLDILSYTKSSDHNIKPEEQEAFIIANDIKAKIASKYPVFNPKTKESHPATYNDFVILMDRGSNFTTYKQIFTYLHLPLTIIKDESLTSENDILIIKNLLKLIIAIKNDNYDQDFTYSFISVARSFLCQMSDERLYEVITNNTYKDTELYKKCLALTDDLDVLAPNMFYQKLLTTFNYEEHLLTTSAISTYLVREEYIYNLITDLSRDGNTIYDIVSSLTEILESSEELRFSLDTEGENSIRIMNIHKSKGLEFPICYYSGFYKRFNNDDTKARIVFDTTYGILIPTIKDNCFKPLASRLLADLSSKQENISERLRLLYVALTRAKEKMYIIMPELEEKEEVTSLVSSFKRLSYNSFLSILESIYTILLPYVNKTNILVDQKYINNNKELQFNDLKDNSPKLNVKELTIPTTELVEKHYSKDKVALIDKATKEKMEYGTKVHAILEELNLNNPDLTSVPEALQPHIMVFLNQDLIKNNKAANFYQEYEFLYEEDQALEHGIIDLMIENSKEIIIVDYKLKHLTDEAYQKQLTGYKTYISKNTTKSVSCYLYSILDNELVKII
jgi:ATP-dependent helicase/nuclease subunit A